MNIFYFHRLDWKSKKWNSNPVGRWNKATSTGEFFGNCPKTMVILFSFEQRKIAVNHIYNPALCWSSNISNGKRKKVHLTPLICINLVVIKIVIIVWIGKFRSIQCWSYFWGNFKSSRNVFTDSHQHRDIVAKNGKTRIRRIQTKTAIGSTAWYSR